MIGTTIQNRYQIESEIGRGGLGVIYRARDLLLGREVAVKLLTNAEPGTQGRGRLLREARAIAALNHPHIVAVYDAGEIDNQPFLVMELVKGRNLREYGSLSLAQAIAVGRQLCAALEHAHSQGIIHRDIKPDNVIVLDAAPTPDSNVDARLQASIYVKLMDFGLARSRDNRQTQEGALLGTIYYLAPEQALGQPIDGRADLYSLGVMLYELAAGRLPFEGDEPLAVISQHLHSTPAPPSSYNPQVSPALDAVILKLLAKEPAERYASARLLGEALARLETTGAHIPTTDTFLPGPPQTRHNLPARLTSFIGREKELAELHQMLVDGAVSAPGVPRCLTLVGAGGCGKTSLAIQAAGRVIDDFPYGAWLAELAPYSDAGQVPQVVMGALGLDSRGERPPVDVLADFLRPRRLLLVLDNCEHLVAVCANLVEALLLACPLLSVLATSREALSIPGETVYYVPSLATPGEEDGQPVERLAQYEALRLFQERAAGALPGFQITAANAPAVARICRRLDGIPLAIELAAARLRVLSVEQLAARLDDRFHLLTGGSRTALPRHQTLQATIDWSAALMSEAERVLLRRLSVFAGGWTLEAAEAVCAGDGLEPGEILDRLAGLVNKSMVTAARLPPLVDGLGEEVRYSLLETVRQYGREKLVEAGEEDETLRRHLDYFLQFGSTGGREIRGPASLEWQRRLERDYENLLAALDWAFGLGQAGEKGLLLVNGMGDFWDRHGNYAHVMAWMEKAEQYSRSLPGTPAQAWILSWYGARMSSMYGRLAEGRAMLEESVVIWRALGEPCKAEYAETLAELGKLIYFTVDRKAGCAYVAEAIEILQGTSASWVLGWTLNYWSSLKFSDGDIQAAYELREASIAAFRKSGDLYGVAVSLRGLGSFKVMQGCYRESRTYLEEALEVFRKYGDIVFAFQVLNLLGEAARGLGEYRQAEACYREGLAMSLAMGAGPEMSNYICSNLGMTMLHLENAGQAAAFFLQALEMSKALDDKDLIVCLFGFAALAAAQGKCETGARLFSAWHALLSSQLQEGQTLESTLEAVDRREYEHYQAVCRAQLGDECFEAAWQAGAALSLEQAIAEAVAVAREAHSTCIVSG